MTRVNIFGGIARRICENTVVSALPELAPDISNGVTPALCVYERDKIKPNFRRDVTRYAEMPAARGVKAVWTMGPFTNTIFVTAKNGGEKLSARWKAGASRLISGKSSVNCARGRKCGGFVHGWTGPLLCWLVRHGVVCAGCLETFEAQGAGVTGPARNACGRGVVAGERERVVNAQRQAATDDVGFGEV